MHTNTKQSGQLKRTNMSQVMKLSIISAFASQHALASYTSISETLAEVVSNKTTKSSRSFMAIEQILISDIKRYGCWCYLSQPELDGTELI